MKIEELAPNLYTCQDDDREFTVSHLDGRITLFGTVGDQLFAYQGDFTTEALRDAFPSRQAAVRAAMLHTRGILNKKKVEANAAELHRSGALDLIRLHELLDLIRSCNCAPARFIEKLVIKGYSDVVQDLDLYEESEVMTETSQALMDFINSAEILV